MDTITPSDNGDRSLTATSPSAGRNHICARCKITTEHIESGPWDAGVYWCRQCRTVYETKPDLLGYKTAPIASGNLESPPVAIWWTTSPHYKAPINSEQPDRRFVGPSWDDSTRTLLLDGVGIKTFAKHPAQQQVELIEAFARQQWKSPVVDPFKNPETLRQTVKDLNKSLPKKSLRFHLDGTGEGVIWERA